MNLHGFQDSLSIPNSPNLTDPSQSFLAIMAAARGATWVNHATTGQMAAEMAVAAQGVTFAPGDIVSMMVGTNDCQWPGYETAAGAGYYQGLVREAAVRALCPNRVLPAAMTQSPANSWHPQSTLPPWSPSGYYCNVAGATISAEVSGTDVFVGLSATDWPGGLNAIWPGTQLVEVRIDGNLMPQTITSDWPGCATAAHGSQTQIPSCFHFGGLAPGNHTVQLKLQSGFVYLQHITGSDQPAGPTLLLWTPSTTFQPAQPAGTIAASAAFGQKIIALGAELVAAGRDVKVADFGPHVTAADLGTDHIHWLIGTHASAGAFGLNALGAAVPPPAPVWLPQTALKKADGTLWFADDAVGTNARQVALV